MTRSTKAIFMLPAVIWILLFTLFPLLYALRTSFYSFRFGMINQFVGLDNFERLFTDQNLHAGLKTTLIFVVATVTIEMLLGFALALFLNRELRGKNILRAIMTLWLGFDKVPWLSDPVWAQIAIILVDIWQWTPFVFLVALAGLQSLPLDIYEAARVDGASGWQLLRRITLPLMRPTLWLILLLRLVEAFKVFDIPASLTLGGPGRATEVYSLFTYRTALRFFDHGYAATQGFLLLVIVMFIVSLLFGQIRELYEEGK